MRKSILIGVLAALMLFAFTACDSQVGYKLPVGMSVDVTKTEYLEGEKVDPSTIVAKVDFSDGTSQNFDGSKLGVAASALEPEAGENSVNLTLAYGVGENIATQTITLYCYEVKSIALGNLPTTAAADKTIDTSAVTAVVGYGNGKTRTLTSDDFKVTATATGSAGDKNSAVTVNSISVFGTTLTIGSDEGNVTLTGTDNWKVDVATATTTPDEFDESKFEYKYEIRYYLNGADGYEEEIPATAYVDERWTWEIVAVQGNATRPAVEGEDYFVVAGALPTSKEVQLVVDPATEGAPDEPYEATIVYRSKEGVNATEDTFTIPYGKDYIKAFTKVVVNNDISSQTDAEAADYDFYADWASGAKEKKAVLGTDFEAEILDPTIDKVNPYAPKFLVSYGTKDADGKWSNAKKTLDITTAGLGSN